MDATIGRDKDHYTTILRVLNYVNSPKRDLCMLQNISFPVLRDCRARQIRGKSY